MKRVFIFGLIFGLLLLALLAGVVQAQGPVGEDEPETGGMPGYPAPAKPIPHHEPGHLSRAGSYRTQVVRENELGAQEVVEISGVDAMAADGTDPLAGNYTLVNLDKILVSQYNPSNGFALRTFQFNTPTLSAIPGSQTSIGYFVANDTTAADLNGDGQAEQIAAWIDPADNHVHMSIGEMPGSLGRTTSTPAAVVHAGGSIDLVVRGYDDALWHRHSDDGSSWGAWNNSAGGILLSAPAIASQGDGQFDAFVIGADNQVYWRHWDGSWSGSWQQYGNWPYSVPVWVGSTPELPAPSAVARGGGFGLFRLGPDNTLRWHDGTDWTSLGGMLASGPGVVSLGPDHMQVFARGVDEALWHRTYNAGIWETWQRLELAGMDEGVTIASAPTAVSPASGQIGVYVRGSDNQLWRIQFAGGVWGTWHSLGGELASGVAVTAAEYIAQEADGSLQSSDGSTWANWGGLTPCCNQFDTGSAAVAPPTNNPLSTLLVDVETGYFKGDGREQIVLAYQAAANQITIELYDIGQRLTPVRVVTSTLTGTVPRIATGDIDGDGIDEIGIVHLVDIYRYKVEKLDTDYNEDDIWNLGPPEKASPQFYSCAAGCSDLADDEHWFAGTLRIAAGDFDGDGHDEMAVLSDWADSRPVNDFALWVQLYIFDNDNIPVIDGCRPETDANCPMAAMWRGQSDGDNSLDDGAATGVGLAAGDVNLDGKDEIVLTWPESFDDDDWPDLYRKMRVLRMDSITQTSVMGEQKLPSSDPTSCERNLTSPYYFQRHSYLDTLAVGDLDGDLIDEIVFYNHPHLYVYEFTPLGQITELASIRAAEASDSCYVTRSVNVTTADFTRESMRVGPPNYRVQNRVDTLVALLNMPPKHRDLVKDAAGDYQIIESPKGECNPSPESPDCTHAKYAALDFSSSEQTIQTVHAYEISAGMESEVCAGGGVGGIAEVKACARTSINATHGGNFEKSTEEIQSIGFRRKVIAANDDKVVYFGTPYGMWEYPVLAGAAAEPSEDVFITVAFPLISMTQYPDTSGGYYSGTCDETWYAAGHQPNNVWSYDPIGEVTFEDYDPTYELTYDAIEGDWAEGEITYEKLQSAFSSVSFQHSISARAETEVSGEAQLGVVNVSGSFKAHVQGDYSNTNLETDKLTTSQNTTFSYFFAPQPDSGKFTTRVLFYRARDNYQVLNYQAEPGRAASWQLYDKPDPAFILPWYGFPDPDNPQVPPCGEDQKLFSPDIAISPSHADLGETVTISATVRNFSGETARNVDVRFYQGDPANNIVIGQRTIAAISRESGPETVSIAWSAAGVGRQKIYAVIDPFDTIPEMHDEADLINNNMAYGLVQLAAANFADMGLVADQPPYDAIFYALGDPRPTVSLYVPRASLAAVARFEVGGTEIGIPVEGRVFKVTAYQGSKYKLWSDPIADFNLKLAVADPPAVIIIAYTPADISALDENSLKLYRLVGTQWTEATCSGYQIHRFPAEDLIAVPICQTGIFAFSDGAPGPIVPPVAQFSAIPLSGTAPLAVTFTDLSSNYPTSWIWDFGDGTTSTAQNPTHTYLEPGTYEVSLTVTNEAASNTHTKPGYINAYGMRADFIAAPVWGSAPLTVTFTDLSAGIGVPGPTGWAWDFGDETTSTEQHPTHTYFANGVYTVTLTASNGDASDTKVKLNFVTVADVTPIYLPLIFKDSQ